MTSTTAKLAERLRIDELIETEAAALAERLMVLLERLDVIHADVSTPGGRRDSDR